MATPVVTGKTGILKAIISFVIILAIIIGLFYFVANLTPNKLGLGNVQIQGKTLQEQGLADYKIKDIIEALKTLSDSDSIESNIVTSPTTAEDEEQVAANLQNSSIASASSTSGAKPDYSSIANEKVIYTEKKEIEYSDREICVIVSNIMDTIMQDVEINTHIRQTYVSNMVTSSAPQSNGFSISVKQLRILPRDGKNYLSFIVKFDLSQLTKQEGFQEFLDMANKVPFISIPDPLVFIVSADIDLILDTTNHALTTGTDSSILIQNNQMLTNTLFSLVGDQANQIQDEIMGEVGDLFCRVVNNLGKVMSITDGKIVFETYTAEDVE